MFSRYWLLLGVIPLAAGVTDSQRETVTYSMMPMASASEDDPLGLQSAIAMVRRQPRCHRRSWMR